MRWTSALAIYFLIWFLCLFLVLPFYGRRSDEEGERPAGHDPGAPARFRMGLAVVQVTLGAALLFATYYAVYTSGAITRDTLNFFGQPPD